MTGRLVGLVNGGPPTPTSDDLLWYSVFIIERVCPRCLAGVEVPLTLRAHDKDAMLVVAQMNSGKRDDEIQFINFELGVESSVLCHRCGERITVSSHDLDRETFDAAEDTICQRESEFTQDVLESFGLKRREP